MYYAIIWTYGRATDLRTGGRCGQYVSFTEKSDRDKWVNDGPSYTNEYGFREAIPSSDRELRSALRLEKSGRWPAGEIVECYDGMVAEIDWYAEGPQAPGEIR